MRFGDRVPDLNLVETKIRSNELLGTEIGVNKVKFVVENTKIALIKFAGEKRRNIKRKIKVDAKSLIEYNWMKMRIEYSWLTIINTYIGERSFIYFHFEHISF